MRTRMEIDVKSITLDEVMNLINPSIKKVRRTGEIQLLCPLNPKEDFDVNVHTGSFKCWHNCPDCPVGGKGNSVNLYRLFNPGLSFGKALRAISEKRMTPMQTCVKVNKPKLVPNADSAPIEVRDKTYRALLSLLSLSSEHQEAFRKRGLNDEQIKELGVRSIPTCGIVSIPKMLQKMGCTLKGVPLFGTLKNGQWGLGLVRGKTGCYIPYCDRDGRIQQLQIRYDIGTGLSDDELYKQKNNRYRWATSGFMPNGCSATNIIFWGRAKKFQDDETVYLTEGGIKASVASYLSGLWFIGTTSVSTTESFAEIIDWCKANNKVPVDAYDMDGKILPDEVEVPRAAFEQNKDAYPENIVKEMARSNRILVRNKAGKYRVVNGNVKASLESFHEIAANKGVHLYTWYWDPNAKGIDDYLLEQTYRDGSLTWNNEMDIDDDADNLPVEVPKKKEDNPTQTLVVVDQTYIPDVF